MGDEKIPNGWKKYRLEELCFFKTGGTPPKQNPQYFGGDIRWIVSGDVNQEFIYDVNGRITESGLNNSAAKYLPINSVLIALNGQGKTRGSVAILKTEATCNQSIIALIPKDDRIVDYKYLFYYLKMSYQRLRNLTGDNERSGLSMRVLKPFTVLVPSLVLQKEIVSQLDQKMCQIENMRTEVEKQLIMTEYSEISILNSLFSKYESSKKVKLKDLVTIKGGGTPSKSVDKFWVNGKYDWISVKNIINFRINYTGEKITDEAVESSSTNIIPPNSLIIATRMMNKDKIAINNKPLCINQDLKALIPNKSIDVHFLFYFLRNSGNKLMAMSNKGATVAGINQEHLLNLEVDYYSLEEQKSIVESISEKLYHNDLLCASLRNQFEAIDQLPVSILENTLRKHESSSKV